MERTALSHRCSLSLSEMGREIASMAKKSSAAICESQGRGSAKVCVGSRFLLFQETSVARV
jgi:hypothetical protein